MAELILDYYTGADLYTDGAEVEEEIYQIVVEDRIEEVLTQGDIPYPQLYHLSYLRENIVAWYPFTGQEHVLEVGAGMGAITGALCARCQEVTAVELSKKRAEINFARHKGKENLKILVGNLNDIFFNSKFDVILLNGVLEYAAQFTGGDEPYADFLRKLAALLNPGGKILLAIENRLGLKYWAGAPEDHTGAYFDGLQEYPDDKGARTFSRKELEDVLNRAGLPFWRFYYPYPDYKFPVEIFTDSSAQRLCEERHYTNLDAYKFYFFNEAKMRAQLGREGAGEIFANSFFVEAQPAPLDETGVEYAKLSADRRASFRIATLLTRKNDERQAVKLPLHPSAEKHLQTMMQREKEYSSENLQYLASSWQGKALVYPFLQGTTLLDAAQAAIEQKDKNKLRELIQDFFGRVFAAAGQKQKADVWHTPQFEEVFGPELPAEALRCIMPANIDLIAENVFIQGDNRYTVIDCEWVFPFAVPALFILWRSINDLYARFVDLPGLLSKQQWLQEWAISPSLEQVFLCWINHFATCYVQAGRLNLAEKKPLLLDFTRARQHAILYSSLYYHGGEGLREENKVSAQCPLYEGAFELCFPLPEERKITEIFWDPLENEFCLCHLAEARDQDGNPLQFRPLNAQETKVLENGNQGELFVTSDPRYILETPTEGIRAIFIKGWLKRLEAGEITALAEEVFLSLRQDIECQRKEIDLQREEMALQREEMDSQREEIRQQRLYIEGFGALHKMRQWRIEKINQRKNRR